MKELKLSWLCRCRGRGTCGVIYSRAGSQRRAAATGAFFQGPLGAFDGGGTYPEGGWHALSHSSRNFDNKIGPIPPTSRPLQNLPRSRPATTPTVTTPQPIATLPIKAIHNTLTRPFLRRPLPTRARGFPFRSFAHLSSSPTQPRMAEVKWTGLKVRQTFFDYFEQRGHTVGMLIHTLFHLQCDCNS